MYKEKDNETREVESTEGKKVKKKGATRGSL